MMIRKIGVLSLAKIVGAIYCAMGLILGLLFSIATLFGGVASELARETAIPKSIAMIFGFGAIIAMPILYGILGFLMGAFAAFVYNIVAGVAGGLELELAPAAPPSSSPSPQTSTY